MNSEAYSHITHVLFLKCGSMLNIRSNDFIRRCIARVTSCKRKNHFGSHCGGEGGVVGIGRVVGVPKFYS